MREPISDMQWAAARALSEGEPQTHARIAACLGVHATTVSHKAAEQGWKSIDYRHQRVRVAQRGVVALSAALRAVAELDPARPGADGLDEATRDAIAAAGLSEPAHAGEDTAGGVGEAELEALSALPPDERIARIGAILTRHTEVILLGVEAGRPLEGRQIAALAALVQLAERIAVMAREEVRRQEAEDEEQLAGLLDKINARMDYLAHCEARRLAAEVFGISRAEVDEKLPALQQA